LLKKIKFFFLHDDIIDALLITIRQFSSLPLTQWYIVGLIIKKYYKNDWDHNSWPLIHDWTFKRKINQY